MPLKAVLKVSKLLASEKEILFPENITENILEDIKKNYRKIEPEDEDLEGKRIRNIYFKANKNAIDWAMLFQYSYVVLSSIKHKSISAYIGRFSTMYNQLSFYLEEYNKPIAYGKNSYHNRILSLIYESFDRINDIIQFVFTRILEEAESPSNFNFEEEKR